MNPNEAQKSDLRGTILNAVDIQEELVEVPEWGVTVLVRGMTGKQRSRFLRAATNEAGEVSFDRFYPELVIATTYDPDSRTVLFGPADRDALNEKSATALERLANVATRLSGLSSREVEDAKKG